MNTYTHVLMDLRQDDVDAIDDMLGSRGTPMAAVEAGGSSGTAGELASASDHIKPRLAMRFGRA